jgi:hypothetical protein
MRRIPFEIWLAILVLITHLYVIFLPPNSLVNWFHSDDAFYYFKVAQNITEGHGITFDQLGRDSGFHPLWMIVITPIFALARFDLITPLRLVVLLSAILSAGTAILLYRLSKRVLHPYAAAFIAFFWAFHPLIHANVTEMGLESALSAFMVVLLIYRLMQEHKAQAPSRLRWFITGVIGAMTILARLDNVFLVLIAGIWLVFPSSRLRYLMVLDVILIVFGVLAINFLRVGIGPPAIPYMLSSQVMVVVALVVRVPVYYLLGLYSGPNGTKGLTQHLLKAALASVVSTGIIATVMLALQALDLFPGFPRIVIIYEAGYALVAVLITRAAAALLIRKETTDEPLQWTSVLTRGIFYFGPIGVFLLVYMGSSYLYFGTFMPVSGQIKRWWGTLYTIYGHPVRSLTEMVGFFNLGPWDLLNQMIRLPAVLSAQVRLVILGIPAALLLLRSGYRTHFVNALHTLAIFPLFAGGLIQMLAYTGTSYTHMRPWYWVAQFMLISLIFGILLDSFLKWLQQLTFIKNRTGPWNPALLITAALCVVIFIALGADVTRRMPAKVPPEKAEVYLQEARHVEENTEPGARIGFTGGGTTAYFIQGRTIVNLDGLMNTHEYFRQLKQWRAAEYLDKIGLQYVVAREFVITKSEPYTQFEGRLEEISMIGENTFYRWKSGGE